MMDMTGDVKDSSQSDAMVTCTTPCTLNHFVSTVLVETKLVRTCHKLYTSDFCIAIQSLNFLLLFLNSGEISDTTITCYMVSELQLSTSL